MNLERNAGQNSGQSDPLVPSPGAQKLLYHYLQENTPSLLGTLHGYVLRTGLATGPGVQEVALEIFQESVLEALSHLERFDPQGQPRAWLLGIAVNVLKRRRVAQAKRWRHEALLSDLARTSPDQPDENTLLESLVPPMMVGPAQIVEAGEQATALLALVSPEDQRILRMAVLEGYQHTSLAQELGTTPGTARVRLHRALGRLRAAWKAQQEVPQKGMHNV